MSVLGIVAGVAWFTYEWVRATPFVWGATQPTTVDPTILELVQREVGTAQFVALAAVTAMVVGAVAARYGRREAVASALVPAALFVVAVVLGPRTLPELLFGLGLVLVLSVVPFAIGYAATNPE